MSIPTVYRHFEHTDHEHAARLAGFAMGYTHAEIESEFVDPPTPMCPEQYRDAQRVWDEAFADGHAEYAAMLLDEQTYGHDADHSELEAEEDDERWAEAQAEVVRRWDEEDDGPEPTVDEFELAREVLTEVETPEGYDADEVALLIRDRRPRLSEAVVLPVDDPNQERLF